MDSLVFGCCFDSEFELWSDRLNEQLRNGLFKAVILEIAEFELKFGLRNIKQIVTGILDKYLEFAKLTEETKIISSHYLNEKVMTKRS